ncbi:MAG: F0F1 ATP synthase subunit gamma [Gammaproteobacteria bacterium]|nr:F0F1 ATP synthase subunit gamma [Gammaproteobacteria bacterium]NIR86021.1 F0F1 ATP synthase subunit gamma [Gammaproteobacteria bacterium]NIR92090.1 F0F1 ATP synthase subunit gamma [Gammaproteobacteria bacterium]
MKGTERLRQELESLTELQSIVRTMKALSAASVRQYERAQASLADYYRTVELGLHVVLRRYPGPLIERHKAPPHAGAVVFGSDYGLCGRFNEEIVAHLRQRMAAIPAAREPARTVAVGIRVAEELAAAGQGVEGEYLTPSSSGAITATVQQLLLKLDEWQAEAGIDHVHVFYNRQARGSRYRPTGVQLLPVDLGRFRRLEAEPWPTRVIPTFTMPARRLLSTLLRQYFFVTLSRACAESLAAEHNSRLAAMQSAEKNIDERLEELTGAYRRERQSAITTELLDVVAGFEALTGRTR